MLPRAGDVDKQNGECPLGAIVRVCREERTAVVAASTKFERDANVLLFYLILGKCVPDFLVNGRELRNPSFLSQCIRS